MLGRNVSRSTCVAAVLACSTIVFAQTNTVTERFTFAALELTDNG